MDDFSLVPVEHQPDFENVSLVPVDHDPFGGDATGQQGQTQPVRAQQAPTYYNPEDAAAMSPETYVNPFVKRALGNFVTSAVTLPQRAIDAARVSFEHNYGPGPSTLSDSDVWVDPLPRVAAETALTMMGASGPVPVPAGTILSANKAARGGAAGAIDGHHPFPMYLGGAVKQELVRLPRSLHQEFHKGLDDHLPRWEGKAYYDSLAPTERQEALQSLATYTKDFDAKHSTKLYDALLKNGFSEP